ncbi:MAG: GIY-YIG nuclease family protein [Verrucomicrobiales bacterium]
MNPGYIYILQNPSLSETHLKIGCTTREPEDRAAEISASTGVPTPFEVAWCSEAADCRWAEETLHRNLAVYRTNTTREFFELDLEEAIRQAERAISRSGGHYGGFGYLLGKLVSGIFHSLIRPMLRLPVQIVLLALLALWLLLKFALSTIAWVTRMLFGTRGGLMAGMFGGTRGRRRKRSW